ncbi:MAG: hypothetical protein MJE68_22465 [Proteobacteria bacterium]|nr:hypothetical protein [Pseudomonadota bacterium]
MYEKLIYLIFDILIFSEFDLLVAGGTHKGTESSFQGNQIALDSCTWGTSPLFRALLPGQILLGGAAQVIFPEQRGKAAR